MAASRRVLLCILAIGLFAPNASAYYYYSFGYWYAPPTVYTYYYAPAPVYSYYWVVPSYSCPVTPAATVIPLERNAVPLPAPPSKSATPPVGKTEGRPPAIVSTRTQSGTYVPAGTPQKQDSCRIGFWNLTGRELALTVEGKRFTLAKNRSLTMDVSRNFAWQIEGRPQHVERVPEGQLTHDLVIRD